MSITRLETFEDLLRQLHGALQYPTMDPTEGTIVLTDAILWSATGSMITPGQKDRIGDRWAGEDKIYASLPGLWSMCYSTTVPNEVNMTEMMVCIRMLRDSKIEDGYRAFLKAMGRQREYHTDDLREYKFAASMAMPMEKPWDKDPVDAARYFAELSFLLDKNQRLTTKREKL